MKAGMRASQDSILYLMHKAGGYDIEENPVFLLTQKV